MADDLYEALIGGGVGDRGAVIAEALRRRRDMGALGMITGDKMLSPVGQSMSKSADEYAEMLQQIRQNDARQRQTENYQTGQLDHMDSVLKETIRNNNLDYMAAMAMARASQTKADKAGTGGKIPKLRQGDIKELQDLSETVGTIDSIKEFMANGGKFGSVEVAGVPIPGSRALANTAAAMGFGTEESKATFNAKQHWDRLYNIAERNRMFGATLTANEKKSWDQANPSGNMSDEQIAAALPIMEKVFKHRLDRKASGLMKEGYNAEAIADYADVEGVNLPTRIGGDQAVDETGGGAPQKGPKRIRVDAQGNIIGN